jgi:hypothetical protein
MYEMPEITVKLKCTKEDFLLNKTLLSTYTERQLIAIYEMLTDKNGKGDFSDIVASRLDCQELVVLKENIMDVCTGAWSSPRQKITYDLFLK